MRYTQSGDLDNALLINQLIEENRNGNQSEPYQHPILGEWEFSYQGKRRMFSFFPDGSCRGHYPVRGSQFLATWEEKDGTIFLTRKNDNQSLITIDLREDGTAEFTGELGKKMTSLPR
ncbi:MAG: hypothetical protein ACPGKS_05345 [Coraliomargarita sp.]